MRGVVYDGNDYQVVDDLSVRDRGRRGRGCRIQAAGVCHSDVSVIDGTIPFPTPVVLGHEGAGIVERGRRPVTTVAVGDHVVLSTLGNCGACDACDSGKPTHCRHDVRQDVRAVHLARPQGASSSPTSAPSPSRRSSRPARPSRSTRTCRSRWPRCWGAASSPVSARCFNRAKVTHGQSVLVIGVGGIGLNVIQGARPGRRAADHRGRHQPAEGGAGPAVRRHRLHPRTRTRRATVGPNGVDYAFECVGHPALIRTSIDVLDWGGTLRDPRRARGSDRRPRSTSRHVQRQDDHGLPLRLVRSPTPTRARYRRALPPGGSSSTSWCRRSYKFEEIKRRSTTSRQVELTARGGSSPSDVGC